MKWTRLLLVMTMSIMISTGLLANTPTTIDLSLVCPPIPESLLVDQSFVVCYHNPVGTTKDALLKFTVPPNAIFISANPLNGVSPLYDNITKVISWPLDRIPGNSSDCAIVVLNFDAIGSFSIPVTLSYNLGIHHFCSSTSCSGVVQIGPDTPVTLLRYSGVTSLTPLTPSADIIFPLNEARDLELYSFTSGSIWPHDSYDYNSVDPPLVFYQINVNTDTLRVTKSTASLSVVITF